MRANMRATIVIVLVCALASWVFTIARARQVDLNALCVSNVQVDALGVQMYVQDWDEKFPLDMSEPAFAVAIRPYIRHSLVGGPVEWRCFFPPTAPPPRG